MDIDEAEGAPDDITIRIAWEYMKESQTVTLPVMADDGSLEGLLTVGDIANYYIDAIRRRLCPRQRPSTTILRKQSRNSRCSNDHGYFSKGRSWSALPCRSISPV
jgi:manganese-dependent inorganic pyrophosphatase